MAFVAWSGISQVNILSKRNRPTRAELNWVVEAHSNPDPGRGQCLPADDLSLADSSNILRSVCGVLVVFGATGIDCEYVQHDSLLETAQFTLTTTADVTDFATLRSDVAGGATKPSYTDAVVRAVALALPNHPLLNSRFEDDAIVNPGVVNIGLAVAVGEGLLVPVVNNADGLGLAEMADTIRDLAARARNNELGADAFDGGTFTVTALGAQGIDHFTPIINPPQSAILGVGRVREVPARFGTGLMWRQELPLSLTVDHRINDGYPSSLFLAEVVELLETPQRLI